jgi:hypothetical protein
MLGKHFYPDFHTLRISLWHAEETYTGNKILVMPDDTKPNLLRTFTMQNPPPPNTAMRLDNDIIKNTADGPLHVK